MQLQVIQEALEGSEQTRTIVYFMLQEEAQWFSTRGHLAISGDLSQTKGCYQTLVGQGRDAKCPQCTGRSAPSKG